MLVLFLRDQEDFIRLHGVTTGWFPNLLSLYGGRQKALGVIRKGSKGGRRTSFCHGIMLGCATVHCCVCSPERVLQKGLSGVGGNRGEETEEDPEERMAAFKWKTAKTRTLLWRRDTLKGRSNHN